MFRVWSSAALLILGFGSSGCALIPPAPAPLERPVYELPTLSLAAKAERLHARLLADHLNAEGHLLYNVVLPLSENYTRGHASADLPTWHGIWLSSEAFRSTVSADPEGALRIHRAVQAIREHFACTGVPGLLTRSYLRDGESEAPEWMERYNERDYPTKYWRRGESDCWFRTGVAKGHYAGIMLGLGTLIGLEQRGQLQLPPPTRALIERTTRDLVHHVIDGGYRIRDFDGETTQFGKLSDFGYNGFSATLVTAWLRICAATGDERCHQEYARLAESGRGRAATSLYGKLASLVFGRLLGPSHGWYKPNDTIHMAGTIFAFWLVADDSEADAEVLARYRRLLADLGALAKRDRNPYFNFIFRLVSGEDDAQALREALATLRMFPADKRQRPCTVQRSRSQQWIANLRINSHYWKTRWHKRCDGIPGAPRSQVEYSGQDYLWAFYVGRHFNLISEAEARAPVRWQATRWDPLPAR